MQGVRPGNFLIGQPRNPFAWSNFDPITRTTVETVADGLGALSFRSITPLAPNSIGSALAAIGAGKPSSGTIGTNISVYVPFFLSRTVTVVDGFSYNGATVAGNIDVGVFDANWARVVAAGATAQSGTNTIQTLALTDTELTPGTYYIALFCTNNTATFFRYAALGDLATVMGCRDESGGTALPATATPTSFGVSLPIFGVNIEF